MLIILIRRIHTKNKLLIIVLIAILGSCMVEFVINKQKDAQILQEKMDKFNETVVTK